MHHGGSIILKLAIYFLSKQHENKAFELKWVKNHLRYPPTNANGG